MWGVKLSSGHKATPDRERGRLGEGGRQGGREGEGEREREVNITYMYIVTCTSSSLQHADEEKYKFATPSTMKPTQIKCSEGSINQIPPWTEIQGDIRLTPFYNIDDCLEKVKGYIQDIGNG